MKGLWVGLGLLVVVVLVLLFVGGSYVSTKNGCVTRNEAVDQAYSEVNVEQQRRMDLIPNLVASVKGYVNEESTVLTNIANARAGIVAATDRASSIKAQSNLDVALSPLLRLQEAYPNLKSDAQFTHLTDELAGSENRISVARTRYNRALEDYNVFVQQFPNSIWANMAGYHYRNEYFKGNANNSVAPTVDFGK
jgi:LemA protein